jgi:hypothetical protein
MRDLSCPFLFIPADPCSSVRELCRLLDVRDHSALAFLLIAKRD